jgi:hypothetical protein
MLSENLLRDPLKYLKQLASNLFQQILGYPFLHKTFLEVHGYPLNLKNPKTFSELMNYKKTHDRDPLIPITCDKYRVREYVRKKLGDELANQILIPVYYVSKTGLDIPVESWDFEFFLKSNHSSGRNLLVVPGMDPKFVKKTASNWLKTSYGQPFHEWAYRDIPRRILCEKVLRDENNVMLSDYKFYCFYGKPELITVVSDRNKAKIVRYTIDTEFNLIDSLYSGDDVLKEIPTIPNFAKMMDIARVLSADFEHARIDLYAISNQIFFGEITQYSGSGLYKMSSYETDLKLGKFWLKKQ